MIRYTRLEYTQLIKQGYNWFATFHLPIPPNEFDAPMILYPFKSEKETVAYLKANKENLMNRIEIQNDDGDLVEGVSGLIVYVMMPR